MAEVLLLPFGGKLPVPVEMQRMIFGYFESDMLLESRLVCKNWMNFVDDNNMEAIIWKPHFVENHEADNLSYFTGTRNKTGTFIRSSDQMEEMMKEEYARYGPLKEEDSNQVGAICRTLILQCSTVEEYRNLWQVVPAFVARFGYFIRHLVYFVHKQVPESITNISSIFAEMTNMQSLVIYCQNWYPVKDVLNEFLSRNNKVGVELPNDLQSVTVLGESSHHFLPCLFTFGCGKVKRLKLSGQFGSVDVKKITSVFSDGVRVFPSVEELKLCDVSYSGLWGLRIWPIKLLSVKMGMEANYRYLMLDSILESLMKYAGTLECLHLQFTDEQMFSKSTHHDENLLFPKVHDLRLPYCVALDTNDFRDLRRIFPNMKHLQLVDNENQIGVANDADVLEQFVRQLWVYLPDGLEMISVRYRDYNNNAARRYSYTVHKYFQMKPGASEEVEEGDH